MKLFSPAKTLALLIVAALGFNLATATARADKETELGGKMKIVGKSLKQLKGQLADPAKQQSSIELLEVAKKAADEGKKLSPGKAKDIPEADRAKFLTEYQAEMDKLIGQLSKIEDAVKAGKYDDATKLYGQLNDTKREGHKKFQADE